MNIDAKEVKHAANGKWLSILAYLAGLDERQLSNRHQPCPACGGIDRYRFDDKTGNGDYFCNGCGAGDGIALLQKVNGWDFSTSKARVAEYLGIVPAGTMGEYSPPSMEMLTRRKAEQEAAEFERQRKIAEKHAFAAKVALTIWNAASEATSANPYLKRKGVNAVDTLREIGAETASRIAGYKINSNDVPLCGRVLIAPVNVSGIDGDALSSLEFIDKHGRKAALLDGKKKGGFWATERLPQDEGEGCTIIIGEGVSTTLTAKQAVEGIGVAAFSCNNLGAVARTFRQRYPKARIIVLADIGNGQKDAENAARSNECYLASPVFTPEQIERYRQQQGKAPTDFNDLHQLAGFDVVGEQITAAMVEPPTPCTNENSQTEPADEWPVPQPIPCTLTPVETFNFELLPEALRPWIHDIAERMQCPPDFPAVAVMVAISSVIGRKACIKPKRRDDWTVVPNLWGMIVGRPGMMKSPALAEVLKPLDRLAAQAGEHHKAAMDEHAVQAQMQTMTAKTIEAKAQKKLKESKDEEARELLMGMTKADNLSPPPLRRYKVTDASMEALGEIHIENPWGFLVYRDELNGLIRGLDKEGQEGARAFYLQGYDGNQGYTFDRIQRGKNLHIPAVCIALLGGIQPGKLQSYIHDAVSGGAGDDGLLQRFGLLVWPDAGGEWRNVDKWPDTEAKRTARDTFERLDSMQLAVDEETGEQVPKVYRFTEDAQAEFEDWRQSFENEIRAGELHPAMESHLSKYRKLVPALALVCALADDESEVGHGSLLRALAWSEYLRTHAERAYSAGVTPDTEAARALLAKIKDGKVESGFSPRSVYLKGWAHLGTPEAVNNAARMLCDLNHLRRIEQKPGAGGGRPTSAYIINPLTKRSA